MQRGTQLFIAVLLAVSVAACGNNGWRGNNGTPGAAGTSGSGSALDMGERHFVQDQLKDGAREVELGQLAEKQAFSADVKEFASMMVQDHSRAGNKLKELARKENVEPDKGDDKSRDDYDTLSKKSGADFDKAYIDLMVQDHKDAVDALQDQAQNADHADVKTWAAETLPRVKHHLEAAQQLQDRLNKTTDNKTVNPLKKR